MGDEPSSADKLDSAELPTEPGLTQVCEGVDTLISAASFTAI